MEATVTWPMGTYALPMVDSVAGCPVSAFDWKIGYRHQDTENIFPSNDWSDPYHLKGPYGKSYVETNFCTKIIAREDNNDWEWMAGEYCIYRKGGVCPTGNGLQLHTKIRSLYIPVTKFIGKKKSA